MRNAQNVLIFLVVLVFYLFSQIISVGSLAYVISMTSPRNVL